jgi:hypothetical protein
MTRVILLLVLGVAVTFGLIFLFGIFIVEHPL